MHITNLRYVDDTHTLIDMDVTLDTGETIPFTYSPTDQAPVSCAVRDLLATGSYEIAEPTPPPPPTEADLIAYAADARWRKETGGITVGGVPIATDRESQAMLTGAHAYVQANPTATIKWKSEAGFVELTAEQITALALAVGAHVQACFAKEAEVVGSIGSYPTKESIDAAFVAVQTVF